MYDVDTIKVYRQRSSIGNESLVTAKVKYQPNLTSEHDKKNSDVLKLNALETNYEATGITVLRDGCPVIIYTISEDGDNSSNDNAPNDIGLVCTLKKACDVISMTKSQHLLDKPMFTYLKQFFDLTVGLIEECAEDDVPEIPQELKRLLEKSNVKTAKPEGKKRGRPKANLVSANA